MRSGSATVRKRHARRAVFRDGSGERRALRVCEEERDRVTAPSCVIGLRSGLGQVLGLRLESSLDSVLECDGVPGLTESLGVW